MAKQGSGIDISVYRNREKSYKVMLELQKQRERGTFCDVLLEAKGQQYWAHSCVLAAHSTKLGTAIENGKTKFGSKGVIKMKLPTTNVLMVESLLKYMYDSHLTIGANDVEELLTLATKLQMHDVEQCCTLHLAENLTSTSWIRVKEIGEKHNLDEVERAIEQYCAQNFCDVVHEPDFLEFDLEPFHNVITEANPKCVGRLELHRLYGILKWICHKYVDRVKFSPRLIRLLDPCLLDIEKSLALFDEETVKETDLLSETCIINLFQAISNGKKNSVENENENSEGDDASGDEAAQEPKSGPNKGVKRKAEETAEAPKKKEKLSEPEFPETDDGKVICPKCCKAFEKSETLINHLKQHNEHWLCDICGFTTDVYYDRLFHVQDEHWGMSTRKFECELSGCDFDTDDYLEMRNHFKQHDGRKATKKKAEVSCETCGEIFKDGLELYKHSSVHNEFHCQNCDFTSSQKDQLDAHIISAHAEVALFLGMVTKKELETKNPDEVKKSISNIMMTSDIYSSRERQAKTGKN